jgi:signal transduction histidine kinase
VDLAKVMVACIKLTETQAEKAKVHLVTSIAPELGFIRCDERRLRQIFLNLLSNAVKFTPEGGSVSLTAHLRDDGIAIVVSDSGIGIATHDIPTAFERFGQIDSTLSRKYEGTGLGLPLAKQLAELHGGSLELESEVGVGTVVTLLLPQTRLETQRKIA